MKPNKINIGINYKAFQHPPNPLFSKSNPARLRILLRILLILMLIYSLRYLPSTNDPSSDNQRDTSSKTDGIYESALEKIDKGLPLNEREAKRMYDILHYKEMKQAEEIERKHR